MFKKKKSTQLLPHEQAKHEFLESFGVFVRNDYFQRLLTTLALIIAIICIAFAWHASDKIQTTEKIVSRDKFGLLVAVNDSSENLKIDNQVIAAHLGQYIEDIRTITADDSANSKLYGRAKKITDPAIWEGVKKELVNHWVATGNGDNISKTVNAEITSAIHMGKNTWSIEWLEHFNGSTNTENTTAWKAIITINTFTPNDAATILSNPAGIIVKQINISQVLDTYKGQK